MPTYVVTWEKSFGQQLISRTCNNLMGNIASSKNTMPNNQLLRPSRDEKRRQPLTAPFRKVAEYRLDGSSAHRTLPEQKMKLLPTTAEEFYQGEDRREIYGWTSTLRTILTGTRSPNKEDESPLSLLRDYEHTIIREIYGYISYEYAKHVKLTIPAALVGNALGGSIMRFSQGRNYHGWLEGDITDLPSTSSGFDDGFVAFSICGQVQFPTPAGRNINMMPFILGNINSLPKDLQCYYPLIERCQYMEEEIGKVAYLTIHESFVEAGKAQRRQGLHIESPGFFCDDPNASAFHPGYEHHWGIGLFFGPDKYEGGIYFASNISGSSMLWDALVDNRVPGIVDKHGGCEHLRGIIGQGTALEAGELVWMTDCTPHEALEQKESGYRQFFRLVMPYVTHWYADHSTVNPMVAVPDDVKIVYGSKFA